MITYVYPHLELHKTIRNTEKLKYCKKYRSTLSYALVFFVEWRKKKPIRLSVVP